MAVALEAFVKSLEDSGIIAPGKLKAFIPPNSQPKDAQELARQLVQQKHLTRFQAQEIYLGRAKSLILGNYTILDRIGAGGMGEVYRAEHRRMHRIVAIKMLPKTVTRDAAAVARFEREVEAAARLRHPNIVAADDADDAGGVHFLVLEFVDGSDLSAIVKRNGPLSVAKAVDYILQAAKGLEYAHSEGIVHRDIKPANLLLDKKGVVKILDMGLARFESQPDAAEQAELTNSGVIMGTVDYMAPEQARKTKNVDARADIYSLGCTLHYLLTGKPLYVGESITDKLIAHQSDPIPSLRQARPDVAEALEAVFKMMLAKRPDDRYQSMTDLISDLEHCGGNELAPSGIDSSVGANLDSELLTFLRDVPANTIHTTYAARDTLRNRASLDRRAWWLIGAVATVFGVVLSATVVVALRSSPGTLVVEANQSDTLVEVSSLQGTVETTQRNDGRGPIAITLSPGQHKLKVTKDGFQPFLQDFTIGSGGTQTIIATLAADRRTAQKTPGAAKPQLATVAPGKSFVDISSPEFQSWKQSVSRLAPKDQVAAVVKKLQELNPGFDGQTTQLVKNGVVTEFGFRSDSIADISPITAFPYLIDLKVEGRTPSSTRPLTDLSALAGMRLTRLSCLYTSVSDLTPLQGMPLTSFSCEGTPVSDLSPLAGMRLTRLHCSSSQVMDLSPLQGMPIVSLAISGTPVTDFSVLRELPLTTLVCSSTSFNDLSLLKGKELNYLACTATMVSDLSPLIDLPLAHLTINFVPARDARIVRSIKTLEFINGQPAAEFWQEFDAQQAAFEQWVEEVGSLPAEQQAAAVAKKLQELNPGFDGNAKHTLENDVVATFEFNSDQVADLSPVRALAGLKQLNCSGKATGVPRLLADLSPLAGMKLTRFVCTRTQVSDLSALRGMPLTMLNCSHSKVADLSVVKGMPLIDLRLAGTRVSDFSPLQSLPLTRLVCDDTGFADLSPLKGMKLTELSCKGTRVTDLSALAGMPLRTIDCDFQPARDGAALRAIKTLERINGKPAAEFWKQFDTQPPAQQP